MTPPPVNQSALAALMLQRCQSPFAWGATDCALWAFDAVRAATGRDPAADLRGQYGNALQAMRRLAAEGGWPAVCAARVGEPIALCDVEDGDVLLLDAGVCTAEMATAGALAVAWKGVAVAQGGEGLVQVPLTAAAAAWRPRHG